MASAMAADVVVPVIVDWTSASAARFLSTVSQLSQHAMRHFRRAAFRGGRGKLVAAKQLNGTAASGGKGSYHHWRYLTEETEGPAQSFSLRISYAPTLPPFAAMPFLTGQKLLATLGRELRVPTADMVLRPLLLMTLHRSPCFAATPLVHSPAAVSAAEAAEEAVAMASRRGPGSSAASTASSHPVARYAALAAKLQPLPRSRDVSEADVVQRLRTAFTAWVAVLHGIQHEMIPDAMHVMRGRLEEWMHVFAPAARRARADTVSPERMRSTLLQYAALGA